MTRQDSAAQTPLTPAVLHILLALAEEERHGYAIAQEIETATDGDIHMGPGTLYGLAGACSRLSSRGWRA